MVLRENGGERGKEREKESFIRGERQRFIYHKDANKKTSRQRTPRLQADSSYYVYYLPQGIVFVLFHIQKCFMFNKTGIINV